MKTIALVYINAGGGHRAAALALQQAIAMHQQPWRLQMVDLFRVLDPQQRCRRWLGFEPEEFYNRRLQRGWTLGLGQELKLLQAAIRLAHPRLVRALQHHWAASEPDLVVSLIPNFNRALRESVAAALPGVPYVTVLTDMADHPPHFWIEPPADHQPQVIVCGTPRALEQARAAGYATSQLFAVSGMMLRPAFHAARTIDRRAGLTSLGLDPGRPTGVVMYGGQGSRQMLRIARLLPDLQLLLLAGRNEPLLHELRALKRAAPHAALGFTEDVVGTMALADFFIGKPGPGALSEAVQMQLPVITFRNAWTMPQERCNTEWVDENRVGLVLPSLAALPEAVTELLADLRLFREATARVRNRAVFEVVNALAQVLQSAQRPTQPAVLPLPAARPVPAAAA